MSTTNLLLSEIVRAIQTDGWIGIPLNNRKDMKTTHNYAKETNMLLSEVLRAKQTDGWTGIPIDNLKDMMTTYPCAKEQPICY